MAGSVGPPPPFSPVLPSFPNPLRWPEQLMGSRSTTLCTFLCCAYRFCLGTCQHSDIKPCLQWWKEPFNLSTRESILLCIKEHPILQLAFLDDSIWVATTDSSVHKWPAQGHNPQNVFQRGGSFLARNLSIYRARASLEGSTPAPINKEPILTILGIPGIVQ